MALVLVVDDSVTAQAYCRKVLAAAGHEVRGAASGCEALTEIAARRPDCLVLDLLMPGMSGIELIEALADRPDRPPVVVLTADIQESVRAQCAKLGVRAFINKPASADTLRGAVAEALASPGPRS